MVGFVASSTALISNRSSSSQCGNFVLSMFCPCKYLGHQLTEVLFVGLGDDYFGAAGKLAPMDFFALLGLAYPVCSRGVRNLFSTHHSGHRHDRPSGCIVSVC